MSNIGHSNVKSPLYKPENKAHISAFVLEKDIFSNIFEKDIRRVYLYKKSERLAKALHLISPAFKDNRALKSRIENIALELIEASVANPGEVKTRLSRELLTLSSILSLARTGGHLSSMNVEIISKEVHILLSEIASYEEPRLSLEETPTLAELSKTQTSSVRPIVKRGRISEKQNAGPGTGSGTSIQGQERSIKDKGSRRESILSVLKEKGPSFIKDISTVIRDVSEKTIQRELQSMVLDGSVKKEGERRWTTYTAV